MDLSYVYQNYFVQTLSSAFSCSAYLFIVVIIGFGFFVYYFSIKVNHCAIELQKNMKKRPKKDRITKNKSVIKDLTPKNEIQEVFVNIKPVIKENVIEIEPTENDDNDLWIPVLKTKKIAKHDKKLTKKQNNNSKNISQTVTEIKPIIMLQNEKMAANELGTEVIDISKHCDINQEKEDIVLPFGVKPDEIDSEMNIEKENDSESEHDELITEPEEKAANSVTILSESPTNSSSDDFIFVDNMRMSSDEGGLAVDFSSQNVTEESTDVSGGRTSGASRKKTKKFHKIISKQLIEAAIIEGDEKPVTEELPTNLAKVVSVVKKRRPRKDN